MAGSADRLHRFDPDPISPGSSPACGVTVRDFHTSSRSSRGPTCTYILSTVYVHKCTENALAVLSTVPDPSAHRTVTVLVNTIFSGPIRKVPQPTALPTWQQVASTGAHTAGGNGARKQQPDGRSQQGWSHNRSTSEQAGRNAGTPLPCCVTPQRLPGLPVPQPLDL